MSVNQAIKNLRLSKNLTIEEISERSGININTLYTYEQGRSKPKPDKIKLLAKALEVNESELINSNIEVKDSTQYETLISENRSLRQQVNDLMTMVKDLTNSVNMLSQKLGKLKGNQNENAEIKVIPLASVSVARAASAA